MSAHRSGAVALHRLPVQFTIFELLENRRHFSVSSTYYSLDGSGNNSSHNSWGAANTDLLRIAPVSFGDGVSSINGSNRPSARKISNAVDAQPDDVLNDREMSDYLYAFGQFVDHDLDHNPAGTTELASVAVPKGDPQFDPKGTGTQTIPFTRSVFDPSTGTSKKNPRAFPNIDTSFLDGSVIYGSTDARASALRTHHDGMLKTSAKGSLLPYNTAGLPNNNDTGVLPDDKLFLSGDERANENAELTALITLFMREHNRLAGVFAKNHPTWSDEKIYQHARQIVTAEIQEITYNEFIPSLMGTNALANYTGYNSKVNPGISVEFSDAAFRIGHTLLNGSVSFFTNDGDLARDDVDFQDAFDVPSLLKNGGVDQIVKYLANDTAEEVDPKVEDAFRNFLFGQPGQGGFDLMALDIQRGRDVGLADYNTTRKTYGLPEVTSFSQITSDKTVQAELKKMYGNVNNIDLIVGGLAEDHVAGSSVGPTFQAIMVNQFERTRDGDSLWYQNTFTGDDLKAIQHVTLSDIIRLNTTEPNEQSDPFVFVPDTISGTVFVDADKDGKRDTNEVGEKGITVELFRSDGSLKAKTTTNANGYYAFSGQVEGNHYQIRIVSPKSFNVTTPITQKVHLIDNSGAGEFNVNFGVQFSGAKPGASNSGGANVASLFPGVNQTTLLNVLD